MLEWVGVRQPLRHHRGHEGTRLAQGLRQLGKRLFEAEFDGAVVHRGNLIRDAQQFDPQHVAPAPAFDAGGAIARQYGLPIVEFQSVAQADAPALAAVLNGMSLGHLQLRTRRGVGPIQLVEHQPAMVPGDVGHAVMRVERYQIDLRHEAQHALAFGRGQSGGRQSGGHQGSAGGLQQRPASNGLHDGVFPVLR
jgi:hypothetical protein